MKVTQKKSDLIINKIYTYNIKKYDLIFNNHNALSHKRR